MIKLVIFDFDGVFTDGKIQFNSNGNVIKSYNAKDGNGIFRLHNTGFEVGVISGWKNNESQQAILKHLKIKRISLGTDNKLTVLNQWCNELNITLDDVAYMGDDLNDIEVMKKIGIVSCPNDAIDEVKDISNFICKNNGGNGAIREFCDFLIERKDKKSVTGLICVKYNSTRLPFKNFRKFGNETLLDIKIKKLLKLNFLDKIIVNTESDYIIDYINTNYKNKKLITVKRDIKYATDLVDNREFCTHVVKNINETYILYSPVTMPFIKEETYVNGYKMLYNDKNYDSIVLNADGKQGSGHKHEKHKICFGFSIMKKKDIIKFGDFIGKNPYFVICNSKERMDIDYPEEFNLCLYHYFNKDTQYGLENQHSMHINSLYDLNESSPINKFICKEKDTNNIKKKEVKIIDVTIRDGGFNNKWNWEKKDVKKMLKCASNTGISYFEIGYLANQNILKPGDGPYRNVSFNTINEIVDEIKPQCKISVLFDAWRYDTEQLLPRTKTQIDLVRVVTYVDNEKLLKAIDQCERVKAKGYEVSLNVMCASYFTEEILENLKRQISKKIDILDYVYLADSYGSMEPKDVEYVFNSIKQIKKIKPTIQLGFHIHNNGQIGMANMISSLNHVDIIDASFHGMGRGMGNVRLEDVVLFLKIKRDYNLNIESFLDYISENADENIWKEVTNTILGFLNIHPYRVRDFKDEKSLYNLYILLKKLPLSKKYDYLI